MLIERDVIGYVKVKSWAHSAAHTAYALYEIVQFITIKSHHLHNIEKLCLQQLFILI